MGQTFARPCRVVSDVGLLDAKHRHNSVNTTGTMDGPVLGWAAGIGGSIVRAACGVYTGGNPVAGANCAVCGEAVCDYHHDLYHSFVDGDDAIPVYR